MQNLGHTRRGEGIDRAVDQRDATHPLQVGLVQVAQAAKYGHSAHRMTRQDQPARRRELADGRGQVDGGAFNVQPWGILAGSVTAQIRQQDA